jgi:dsDNA-binding SOS-regulon protein
MQEKTIYVADSGKTFTDKRECLFYEKITKLVENECYQDMAKEDIVCFLFNNREALIEACTILKGNRHDF